MDGKLAYVPALDGLRAFAVAAVIALHAGLGFAAGGALGVDVFFVISGYLITSLLLGEADRKGRIGYGAFLVRRVRRLMPALVVMVVAVGAFAAAAPLTLSPEFRYPALTDSLTYAATYTTDFAILFGGIAGPMFHTWSLGIEMQFYILWPLVVLALAARPRLLVAAFVTIAVWCAIVFHIGSQNHVLYGLDTQSDFLIAGAIVAVGARSGRLPTRTLGRLAPVALVLLIAFVVIAPRLSILAHGGYVVIAVCAAILVAHTATGPATPLLKALALPLVVYVGRLSYSLYLWHFPVFHALTADALGLPRPVTIVIRLAVTVALAAASYHLVENRFRARARTPLQPGVPVPA